MSLQVEELDGGVVVLRLNRPEQRNAFNIALLEAILEELQRLANNADARVIVFSTTSVSALSAGADVAETLDADAGVERMHLFAELYAALESCSIPTVAVCVGNVVGAGAELALGCDLRVGGENLKFTMVGGKLGVPVGPARLIPLVGLSVARDLLLTGRTVGSDEALSLGIVQRATTTDQAESEALELAQKVASNSPAAIRQMKRLIRDFEASDQRVVRENEILVDFQRNGGGLPSYDG